MVDGTKNKSGGGPSEIRQLLANKYSFEYWLRKHGAVFPGTLRALWPDAGGDTSRVAPHNNMKIGCIDSLFCMDRTTQYLVLLNKNIR